jgi:hypothetical protein
MKNQGMKNQKWCGAVALSLNPGHNPTKDSHDWYGLTNEEITCW